MHPHRGSFLHQILASVALITAMASIGCKATGSSDSDPSASTSSRSGTSSSSSSSSSRSPTVASVDDPRVQAQIEENFVIGPAAARDINYRVAWQYSQAGDPIKRFDVTGDSVFTLDTNNVLTRLRLEDGSRLWKVAVAKPIEEIQGLNYIDDRIYLANGGFMLVYDAVTGAQVGRQTLHKIANTQPVHFNQYLVYGSRDGQVIWHAYSVAFHWRGYQVAKSIQVPLLLVDRYIAAIGNDGSIMVLNAPTAEQFWGKRLLNPVVSQPAAGEGVLYVAGKDQYLHALDLGNGRSLWRTLFDSPITESPTYVNNRVYLHVPTEGLVCFDALPADSPGGKILWKAPSVKGNVVLQRRNTLFAWDDAARSLTLIDATHGSLVQTLKIPHAKFLNVPGGASSDSGDIFAAGDNGRVVRLVPRN